MGLRLRRSELVLLATLRGTGALTLPELRRMTGSPVDRSLFHLRRKGLVESGYWFPTNGRPEAAPEEGRQYVVTPRGLMLLRVADGRECAWCGAKATDGAEINGAATNVYWCEKHHEIGERSAREGKPASQGSLAGQIRAGRIGRREPDEVRA